MNGDCDITAERRRELITFFLAEQEFCMDIMLVREIRGWTSITALPHAPPDVIGVMNLRGRIVPIVDLAARLGMLFCEPHDRNVIVVTSIGDRMLGFLVTAVSGIIDVAPQEVQTLPQLGNGAADAPVTEIIVREGRSLRVLCPASLSASVFMRQDVS